MTKDVRIKLKKTKSNNTLETRLDGWNTRKFINFVLIRSTDISSGRA